MCNQNFTWDPQPTQPPPVVHGKKFCDENQTHCIFTSSNKKVLNNEIFSEYELVPNTEQQVITLVLSISIPILILALTLPILYWCYRRKKLGYFNEVSVK